MSKKTYRGHCPCGRVEFEADVDLDAATACNCSFCKRVPGWCAVVGKGAGSLRALAGASDMESTTFDYRNTRFVYCRHCGSRPFSAGHLAVVGSDTFAINVACLDRLDPPVQGAVR